MSRFDIRKLKKKVITSENNEHLKLLEEGVEIWNEWREKNPDVKPDFRGTKLKGAKLWGANFKDADFEDANLKGADLQNANLQGG